MGNFFVDAANWYRSHKLVRILAAVIVTYFFMKYFLWLVLPFLLSILFLNGAYPTIDRLSIHKKGLRALVTGILLFLIGCIPIALVIVMYQAGVHCVRVCVQQFSQLQLCAQTIVTRCCGYLQTPLGVSSKQLESRLLGYGHEIGESLGGMLIPAMTNSAFSCFRLFVAIGILWGVFYLFSILLARDYEEIRERFLQNSTLRSAQGIYSRTVGVLGVYFKAQLIIVSVIGGLCSLVFWWAGFSMPFFWGYLVGFLDMLPFIGTGITLIPVAIYQALTGRMTWAVIFLFLYIACYFLRQFMEPRLIGNGMGIHPLVMIVAIYIGIRLFGLSGILTGPISYLLIRELSGTCNSGRKCANMEGRKSTGEEHDT